MPPTWLVDTLAGVMVATSSYCVIRLVAARRWGRALHRDVNVAHVAMGTAMAGMLVPSMRTLPNDAWAVVFAAFGAWFAVVAGRLVVRGGIGGVGTDHAHRVSHNLTHFMMSGAMLYMFAETPPSVAGSSGSMAAMSGTAGNAAGLAGVTLLLLFIIFASAVWHLDGLSRYTTAPRALVGVGASPDPAPLSPATAAGLENSGPGSSTEDRALSAGGDADQARWLAPRLEIGCHIAMCITMGYMLVLLL